MSQVSYQTSSLKSSGSSRPTTLTATPSGTLLTTTTAAAIAAKSSPPTAPSKKSWVHNPHPIILLWLYVSLPLVFWDMSYVALRPHSMPGGKWHLPWKPYAIYCRVDLVYGFAHHQSGDGFNPAQTTLNFFETMGYLYYLSVVRSAAGGNSWGYGKKIVGRTAGKAVLVAFAAAVATFSKTVLYWLVEILGQYKNIGHNSTFDLIWFWIIPNGLWLIFPPLMIYTFGGEIIKAVSVASDEKDGKDQ